MTRAHQSVLEWIRSEQKAPDGTLIRDNFSSWFAQSRVRDEKGLPRVVYHGTSGDFDAFENPYAGKFWEMFSTSADYAVQFALGGGANIMPVFLSLQNPLDLSGLPRARGDVRPKLLRSLSRAGVDMTTLTYSLPHESDLFQIINIAGHHTDLDQKLQQAGFDGIIMPDYHGDIEATSYIAFSPEQIKSAVGNVGTFDPADPSISDGAARSKYASMTSRDPFGPNDADVGSVVQRLLEKEDCDVEDLSYDTRVALMVSDLEAFGTRNFVEVCMQPWNPNGMVTGVELTDFFAENPGNGNGSRIMHRMSEFADVLQIAVYLRPSGPRNRTFYERFGYQEDKRNFGFLARYPVFIDEEEISFDSRLQAAISIDGREEVVHPDDGTVITLQRIEKAQEFLAAKTSPETLSRPKPPRS